VLRGESSKCRTALLSSPFKRTCVTWIAARVGCRRQTIVDLEAGRNVELNALFGALGALGKGLAIVDARVDVERLNEVFRDED
jgi:hypothetical protein